MKQYSGAIFDMDGVLFDTECVFQQTWEEIAGEMGIALDDGFTQAISGTNGVVMCQVIQRFYHVADGTEIMNRCRARIREKLSRHVPVKEGAREILEYFRSAGIRIAVASSSSRDQIQSNLNLSGLDPWIDAIVSGEDVAIGKPDPAIFLCAAKALHCTPEQCFVFEDSMSGVRAGHAAGCDTFLIPDLIQPSPDIVPLCFRIVDSLTEALEVVKTLTETAEGPEGQGTDAPA